MLCIRFSFILFVLFSFQLNAKEKFTSQECLQASFETDIKQGKKYFGLVDSKLTVKKDKCSIKIFYKNILEKEWLIDICREPVHMKITTAASQSVFKRETNCELDSKNEFCQNWKELSELILDYGLIYAEGERELLSTSHGKTYCSYLLLKKHLGDGVLFSTFEIAPDLYSNSGCSIKNELTPIEKIEANSEILKETNESAPEESVTQEEDRF